MNDGMTPWVIQTVRGVRWQVLPACRDDFLGPDGLRLPEWLRDGAAEVVKQGPHQSVYRVSLPGQRLYVKHYRVYDLRSWLRRLVRPSKARGEWRRAEAVAGRGVPTVTTLAVGECGGRFGLGDSYLITRSLDDTEPLNAFLAGTLPGLPEPRRSRVRQRLAAALGDFLARMHDAGVCHLDLHSGNLLVRLGADDRPLLFLIDLHAVSVGRPLGWRASRDNLVLLNRWFVLCASRTDRLRFWSAYDRSRRTPVVSPGARVKELERLTWRSNLDFWSRRDRRCLGRNRHYRIVRSPAAVGHAIADLDASTVAALAADPDAPFRRPGVRLLKDSRSSTVAELEISVGGEWRKVVYKRFRVTAWSDPWTALVRRSPALRSWLFGHGLRERLLPTPRPLLVLHRRRRGLYREGYLLTEKVEPATELHGFVRSLSDLAPEQRQGVLRRVMDQVARLVRDLHRRRLSNRDLKAANILVASDGLAAPGCGASAEPSVFLIDLVGVKRHRRLPRRVRVQNLARLNASFLRQPAVSRTDRLRFLRVYLHWGLLGRRNWKRWWREVEAATQAKAARNLRKQRPLS